MMIDRYGWKSWSFPQKDMCFSHLIRLYSEAKMPWWGQAYIPNLGELDDMYDFPKKIVVPLKWFMSHVVS